MYYQFKGGCIRAASVLPLAPFSPAALHNIQHSCVPSVQSD